MLTIPKPYPQEFRDDVVAVARKREAPLKQIAKDFGISEGCLSNRLKKADVQAGTRPGLDDTDRKELREVKKRGRLLEQENEVLRRAAVACRVSKISRQAYYQWCAEPVIQRDWVDAHTINALREIHEDDPTLGYRFLTDELDNADIAASENRVWRLCSMAGVFASHHRRRAKSRKPRPASRRALRSSGPVAHRSARSTSRAARQANFTAFHAATRPRMLSHPGAPALSAAVSPTVAAR